MMGTNRACGDQPPRSTCLRGLKQVSELARLVPAIGRAHSRVVLQPQLAPLVRLEAAYRCRDLKLDWRCHDGDARCGWIQAWRPLMSAQDLGTPDFGSNRPRAIEYHRS